MNLHPAPRRRAIRLAAASLAGLASLSFAVGTAGAQNAPVSPGTRTTPSSTPATGGTTTGTTPPSLKVAKANMVAAPATTDVTIFWTGVVHDDNGNVVNGNKPVEAAGGCTAFTVASNGYLATAGHCVDEAGGIDAVLYKAVQIEVASGDWTTGEEQTPVTTDDMIKYAAKHWTVSPERDVRVHVPQVAGHVTGSNDHNYISARVIDALAPTEGDISLLKIEASDLPVLELADSNQVREGMDVLSIGFASATGDLTDDGTPTYKDGKVSSIRTMEGGKLPVYETSAALNPGMSGGPSVDPDGRVIGVNSFHHRDAASFNYIMPSSLVSEMLHKNGVDTTPSAADTAYREALDAMNAGDAVTADAKFKDVLAAWPTHAQALKLEKDAAAAAASAPKPMALGAGAVIPKVSAATDGQVPAGLPVGLLVAIPMIVVIGGVAMLVLVKRSTSSPRPATASVPAPPAFGGPAGFPPAAQGWAPAGYNSPWPAAQPAPAPQPAPAEAYAPAAAGWGRETVTTSPMVVVNPKPTVSEAQKITAEIPTNHGFGTTYLP